MVRITSFAVFESICKLRLRISTSTAELTPLRPEYSKEPTRHAADSVVGRSLALFVHLSTTSPPTPAAAYSSMLHDGLPAYGATAPSCPAQRTPQTLRSLIAWLALQIQFQPSLHGMHMACYIGVKLPLARPGHSSPNL